jgi:hypothetical protein
MKRLPSEHHYVRYCKPAQVQDGRALPSAFTLREGEDGLSGDHFEHFESDRYRRIAEALRRRGFTPKPGGYFVKVRCGDVIKALQDQCAVSFIKEDEANPHTLLCGLDRENEYARLKLAQAITETVSLSTLTAEPKGNVN